jgi:hypothetical protein
VRDGSNPGQTLQAGTAAADRFDGKGLLFTEENTFTTISFDSQPGDLNPVPPEFIDQIGDKQLAAIQEGLPNVPPPA